MKKFFKVGSHIVLHALPAHSELFHMAGEPLLAIALHNLEREKNSWDIETCIADNWIKQEVMGGVKLRLG